MTRINALRPMLAADAGRWIGLCLVFVALALASGCAEEKDDVTAPGSGACVGCHTDVDQLIATAEPDTVETPEEPGEG